MNSAALSPLRCVISPDADDLFMFRAILLGLIDTEGLSFEISTQDTDTLNRMARNDGPDITAISIARYPEIAGFYQLFNHGGSMGRGYGPALVAPQPGAWADLKGRRIGVPGLTTTAYRILQMAIPEFTPVVIPIVPHAAVFDALRDGTIDAAVVIHEGRLTFADEGMTMLLDLGAFWQAQTGLPLPLGGNVIRRDLPADVISRADTVIRASIQHGLAHRDDAIAWLLARGGALGDPARVDRYLGMYANIDSVDWGDDGREAIRRILNMDVDFVGGG